MRKKILKVFFVILTGITVTLTGCELSGSNESAQTESESGKDAVKFIPNLTTAVTRKPTPTAVAANPGDSVQNQQSGNNAEAEIYQSQAPFTLKGGGTKMIPIARPRIVVEGGEVFYIFRDEERGSRVSMAHATDVGTSKWTITDLTDFSVDAWEPSHDTELWKKQRKLHLFVQHTRQGNGERTAEIEPQMIYVLETDMDTNK